MKDELLEILCCPDCRGDLELRDEEREEAGEILSGGLYCAVCKFTFPISDGIPNLLPQELHERAGK